MTRNWKIVNHNGNVFNINTNRVNGSVDNYVLKIIPKHSVDVSWKELGLEEAR